MYLAPPLTDSPWNFVKATGAQKNWSDAPTKKNPKIFDDTCIYRDTMPQYQLADAR